MDYLIGVDKLFQSVRTSVKDLPDLFYQFVEYLGYEYLNTECIPEDIVNAIVMLLQDIKTAKENASADLEVPESLIKNAANLEEILVLFPTFIQLVTNAYFSSIFNSCFSSVFTQGVSHFRYDISREKYESCGYILPDLSRKLELKNKKVDEKFKNVRSYIPGLPEDFYAFVEYMGEHYCNPELNCIGIITSLMTFLNDLTSGINQYTGDPIPDSIIRNNLSMYLTFLPVFVKSISFEDFYKEFMNDYNLITQSKGYEPIQMINAKDIKIDAIKCDDSVQAAVTWWANAIQCSYYHSFSVVDQELIKKALKIQYTTFPKPNESEIKLFMIALSKRIMTFFKEQYEIIPEGVSEEAKNAYLSNLKCNLVTDYKPKGVLNDAVDDYKRDGGNTSLLVPFRVKMEVGMDSITIDEKVVWNKEKGWVRPNGDEDPKMVRS